MKKKTVVITGIGPISSAGIGKGDFWRGILEKKTHIVRERYRVDGELWGEFFLHKVRDFDIARFGIDRESLDDIRAWKEGEEIPDLNYLLAAVKLALDDSRLDYRRDDNGIGLVLAHENIGLMEFAYKVSDVSYEMLTGKNRSIISKKEFFDTFYKKFLKSGYDVQTFADLFHVAKVFNIHNYSLFINNACASGLYAFEAAAQIIRNGQARAVVIAAADHPEIYKYLWFKELGIYSPDGVIRPFCKDSNGLVFGDGGVGIVMEDGGHARGRNAPVYAEYLGAGFDLEGWKITVPRIGSNSYQTAIARAFEHSGVTPAEIDLLCPHGVGSHPIDYYEARAITDTFGKNPVRPAMTAFKPYVGHNLGGSALLESAIMILSLFHNIIPPALNCENPDPRFNISLVTRDIGIPPSRPLQHAMKICCAFAGFNAAAVFRKFSVS